MPCRTPGVTTPRSWPTARVAARTPAAAGWSVCCWAGDGPGAAPGAAGAGPAGVLILGGTISCGARRTPCMNTEAPSLARRGDLDALRAVAMLLGIALHAALSFFPAGWPVLDSRQAPAF